MTAYVALLLASVGTYAVRVGSVVLAGRRPLSTRTHEALRHAALAMLVALAVAGVPRGDGGPAVRPEVGVALVAAAVIARRTGNVALVVVAAVVTQVAVGLVL